MGDFAACSRRWRGGLMVFGLLRLAGCGTPEAADTQSSCADQQVGVVGLRDIVLVTTNEGGRQNAGVSRQ